MSTERARIAVRGIEVEVVRRDIKHLHLSVHPPEGRVRVAAPLRVDDDAVRLAVITRLAWIRRKREEFRRQDRQSRREFVTGESHWFEGRRYRLDVVEGTGRAQVRLRDSAWMEMRVRTGADCAAREAALRGWYRARLRERIPEMVAKWEPRIGVAVAEWRIRRMKTRWGSCNPVARRIWLNLELAKKPVPCLEYVVLHEMAHLVERGHNDRFRRILDRAMPGWRVRLEELNRAVMGEGEVGGWERLSRRSRLLGGRAGQRAGHWLIEQTPRMRCACPPRWMMFTPGACPDVEPGWAARSALTPCLRRRGLLDFPSEAPIRARSPRSPKAWFATIRIRRARPPPSPRRIRNGACCSLPAPGTPS